LLTDAPWLKCKALVLEPDPQVCEAITSKLLQFGLDVISIDVDQILNGIENYIDIAMVFFPSLNEASADIVQAFEYLDYNRPTLPIFFNDAEGDIESFSDYEHHFFYGIEQDNLTEPLNELLYKRVFPQAFIESVIDVTKEAVAHEFITMEFSQTEACLVTESILYGQVFSLIPVESEWYRGYLIQQSTEKEILQMIAEGKTQLSRQQLNFRDVNIIIGESTNLVWGGLKRKFASGFLGNSDFLMQVPLIVNHKRKYISFGSTEPHLCLSITLKDRESGREVKLIQRLVFHLNWQADNCPAISDEQEDGEIEFF